MTLSTDKQSPSHTGTHNTLSSTTSEDASEDTVVRAKNPTFFKLSFIRRHAYLDLT